MGATDAVPSRLEVAIEAAESLIRTLGWRRRGDRVAVVAFAGRGVLRCPLTENLGAAVDALRALRPGSVRPGGTDLAAALGTVLDAFDDQDHAEGRSIVLFSDGEDLAGGWEPVLERLVGQSILVHAVAIGDAETGHPVPSGPARSSEPVQYQGQVVLSKRTDAPLETIAQATRGAMLRLGLASTDLGGLYRERIEPEASSRRIALRSGERAERFALFLLSGLAFILAGFWPARARLSYRRAWFLLPLSVVIASGGADDSNSNSETTRRLIEQGRAAYAANQFGDAATLFEKAVVQSPDNPIPHYDLAASLYQLGRFDEASQHYDEARARARADAALPTKIDYALGNAALSRGNFAEALRHYDDCLGSRARGSALDAVRSDAAINRAFAVEQARRSLAPPEDEPENDSKPPAKSRNPSGAGKKGGSSSSPTSVQPGCRSRAEPHRPGPGQPRRPRPRWCRRERRIVRPSRRRIDRPGSALQGDGEHPRSPQAPARPITTHQGRCRRQGLVRVVTVSASRGSVGFVS